MSKRQQLHNLIVGELASNRATGRIDMTLISPVAEVIINLLKHNSKLVKKVLEEEEVAVPSPSFLAKQERQKEREKNIAELKKNGGVLPKVIKRAKGLAGLLKTSDKKKKKKGPDSTDNMYSRSKIK